MKQLRAIVVLALLATASPVQAQSGWWGFLGKLRVWDRRAPTVLYIANDRNYPIDVFITTTSGISLKIADRLESTVSSSEASR